MKKAQRSRLFQEIYGALSCPRPGTPREGPWGSPPGWLVADAQSLLGRKAMPMEAALWPGGRNLVVLVHGVGVMGPLWKLYTRIIRGLQEEDTACALLFLPNHGPRATEGKNPVEQFGTAPVRDYLTWAHASVADIRGLTAWGKTRYDRVGLFGVSLGGMIGTIALAMEKDLDAGFLVITGGGLPRIVDHGMARFFTHPGSLTERLHRRGDLPAPPAILKDLWRMTLAREPLFLLDPLTFAPLVNRERVRMAIARWDPIMPREASLDLWRALGRPSLDRISGVHGSVLLFHRDLFVRRMTELLERTEGRPTS